MSHHTPLKRITIPSLMQIKGREPIVALTAYTTPQAALLARGFTKIDYLEMRDATTLTPTRTTLNARLFAAAYLGNTRLIDNIAI